MTITRIEEKIAKLLRLAQNNPSAEEAAQAFARAQEIATRHDLNLEEIGADEEEHELPEIVASKQRKIDDWKKRVAWKTTVGMAVARANGCKVFYRSGRHGNGGLFAYGQPADLQRVHQIYNLITSQIEVMGKTAVKKYAADPELDPRFDPSPRVWGRSFRMGCADEVYQRMPSREDYLLKERKMLDEARVDAVTQSEDTDHEQLAKATTALVRVDKAAEYVEQAKAATEAFGKSIGLRSGSSTSSAGSRSGYRSGRTAGASINTGSRGALK